MNLDQLILKQGPLAHVWLAANYDKKLSKQQFLSTSIISSSEIISTHPISYTVTQDTETRESVALRLSGQLLLGIVKIYSRKTKYLLEDVNDILLKLKTSFKYASGINLGSDIKANLVNLEPQKTIVSDLKNIILPDQVTGFDLLYQEELRLDEEPTRLFAEIPAAEETFIFEPSIEFPRYGETFAEETGLGVELDFELEAPQPSEISIELGREAPILPTEEREISLLEEFEHPLETIGEIPVSLEEPEVPPPIERLPYRRRTGITEEGELITNKRKLQIDSLDALDGISIQTLKENQELLLSGQPQYVTLELPESQKLELVYELATPISTKRRKLWTIDEELHQRSLELARVEERVEEEIPFEHELGFELSLPGLESPISIAEVEEEILEQPEIVEEEEYVDTVAKSTIQIAGELREIFTSKEEGTNFTELVDMDFTINEKYEDKLPLGVVSKAAVVKTVNKRKEAAKCFFELLVLATHDCVSIDQEASLTTIGGTINITSRDRIFSNFL